MSARAKMTDSPAWKAAKPAVSVLIPFLRDDPAELLGLLDEELARLSCRPDPHLDCVVEVCLQEGIGDLGDAAQRPGGGADDPRLLRRGVAARAGSPRLLDFSFPTR